jgi:hypothetical protein
MRPRDPWTGRPLHATLPPVVAPADYPVPRGRDHLRASVRTEIWLGHDGIFTRTPGELRDLSVGGACVQTSQRFAIGSLLNMRFQLPQSPGFVSGTVAVRNFRADAGMGVQFVDLSDDDRRRISGFIDRFGGASSW